MSTHTDLEGTPRPLLDSTWKAGPDDTVCADYSFGDIDLKAWGRIKRDGSGPVPHATAHLFNAVIDSVLTIPGGGGPAWIALDFAKSHEVHADEVSVGLSLSEAMDLRDRLDEAIAEAKSIS